MNAIVRCSHCRRELNVDIKTCLSGGWPKCCGYAMNLAPNTYNPCDFGRATTELCTEADRERVRDAAIKALVKTGEMK